MSYINKLKQILENITRNCVGSALVIIQGYNKVACYLEYITSSNRTILLLLLLLLLLPLLLL